MPIFAVLPHGKKWTIQGGWLFFLVVQVESTLPETNSTFAAENWPVHPKMKVHHLPLPFIFRASKLFLSGESSGLQGMSWISATSAQNLGEHPPL